MRIVSIATYNTTPNLQEWCKYVLFIKYADLVMSIDRFGWFTFPISIITTVILRSCDHPYKLIPHLKKTDWKYKQISIVLFVQERKCCLLFAQIYKKNYEKKKFFFKGAPNIEKNKME